MSAAPEQCHYFTLWIKRASGIKMHSIITDKVQPNQTGIIISLQLFDSTTCRQQLQLSQKQNVRMKAVFEMTAIPTLTQAERQRCHWRTAAAIMVWSRLAHSVLMRCLRSSRSVRRVFSVTLNVKMTCTENWLNFVKVMPKIHAVVSFVILTNLYFRISKVVQQRN